MLWIATVIAAVISALLASVLAAQIAKHDSDTHAAIDRPSSTDWWPFWVLHFFSPRKLRMLRPGGRALAIVSLLLLCFTFASMAFIVFRFIRSGATL